MLRRFNLLLVAMLFTSLGMAQGTGTLKGKVKDASTGELLPFVAVILEQNGTVKGTAQTDFDGEYKFNSVTPGTYDLKVQNMGYNKQMLTGIVVSDGKIQFANVDLAPELEGEKLEEFTVTEFAVPLIDKDGGASGGTITGDDIAKMPGRSATSIATTVGGVYADESGSGDVSVRGSRSDATYYYIDGIKVRGSTNLPKSAIQEVSVVTGGVPANYGDATGGIISVTTRGPSSFFFGGIDLLTSGFAFGGDDLGYGKKVFGLDSYAYNVVEGSLSGPLLMRKDSTGRKTTPILGFFISGNFTSQLDSRPSYVGNYRVKKDVRDSLLANPTAVSAAGTGINYNSDFLRSNDFEYVKWRQNAASKRYSAAGKIDVNTAPTVNLTFGGQFDYSQYSNFDLSNALFNWENNAQTRDITWRAYGKFTQRFNSPLDDDGNPTSKIANAYYTVMVDYSKFNRLTQDPTHQDNLFGYGYVGKFDVRGQRSYDYQVENGFAERIQNGFQDTLVIFTPSDQNSSLAAITEQYFNSFDEVSGNYENLNQVLAGNALRNGDRPQDVYNLWRNIGYNYNGYSRTDNTQFRVTASGSADIGDHAVSLGFEFEQRTDRAFSVSPIGLWTIARQYTNNHLLELDVDNPIITQFGTFQQTDYNWLNAAPGEYSGADAQYFFDYNLRQKLNESGNYDWVTTDGRQHVNIDNLDPSLFSLDMFSADEVLNNGNNYVSYYGYDHTGKKSTGAPATFEDFFTKEDEFGNKTRDIAAFQPIYVAGFIMDKFAFDDIIFNVGLRVDRFDANQKVLKDPWLLHSAKTVGEVGSTLGEVPTNMQDDYIVYVNDINNPSGINGFRRNNGDGTSTWFDANGVEVTDPSLIATGSGVAPYLNGNVGDEIKEEAFEDYKPQITVMPRIAFSFPISDEALFFAHYDVLAQRPTTGNRLDVLDYFYMENRNVIVNNPNLKSTKTIDYELGFQQVLSKSSSLKLSAFYREQRDQIALIQIAGGYPRNYRTWGNIDFGTVKGMTVSYDLRRTGNLWMRAAYTLQFAEGTGSDATSAANLINSGQPNLRTIYPYNYDQRHRVTATIDYRYGEGKDYNGPKLFGKDILANTGVNLVANLGSGTPYSQASNFTEQAAISGAQQSVLQGTINGSRKPGNFRTDMQLDKNVTLKFGKGEDKQKSANLNIYLLVNNLLNTRNIVNVYRATGNADDDGFLSSAQAQTTIDSKLDPESYRDLYTFKVNNLYNYGLPRTIRLGVKLDF